MPIKSEAEAAQKLGLSRRTLQRYRYNGLGPNFVRLGQRRLGYTDEALDDWVTKHTFASIAAEYVAAAASGQPHIQ
jgi:predicted DNA-binding transcriptional regulator AlpA